MSQYCQFFLVGVCLPFLLSFDGIRKLLSLIADYDSEFFFFFLIWVLILPFMPPYGLPFALLYLFYPEDQTIFSVTNKLTSFFFDGFRR